MFGRTRKEKAKRLIAAVCNGEADAALALLTDDFVFIDSKQIEISGKAAFAPFLEKFCDLELCLRIDHGELGVSGDQILMSGDQTSRDERLNCRIQWQITFRKSLVCRIQTFRGDKPGSIVRAVEAFMDEGIPAKQAIPARQRTA